MNLLNKLAVALLFGTAAFGQILTTLYTFGSNPNDGIAPESNITFDNMAMHTAPHRTAAARESAEPSFN